MGSPLRNQPCRQQDEPPQQLKHALNGKPQKPKRQHYDPDKGIEHHKQQGHRPAQCKKYSPQKATHLASLSFSQQALQFTDNSCFQTRCQSPFSTSERRYYRAKFLKNDSSSKMAHPWGYYASLFCRFHSCIGILDCQPHNTEIVPESKMTIHYHLVSSKRKSPNFRRPLSHFQLIHGLGHAMIALQKQMFGYWEGNRGRGKSRDDRSMWD
jgi:hypothetical protein